MSSNWGEDKKENLKQIGVLFKPFKDVIDKYPGAIQLKCSKEMGYYLEIQVEYLERPLAEGLPPYGMQTC